MEANQNVIGCILKARVGLVQLPGRLRGQLAQLIAVCYMGKSPKNQVGSHLYLLYLRPFPTNRPLPQQAWIWAGCARLARKLDLTWIGL
jgi:hypothetical protein